MHDGDRLQGVVGLRVEIDVPHVVQDFAEESATKECLDIFEMAPAADLIDRYTTDAVGTDVVVQSHDPAVRAPLEEDQLRNVS
eukprot:10025591-Heterocapsa_arctica.AAC.1